MKPMKTGQPPLHGGGPPPSSLPFATHEKQGPPTSTSHSTWSRLPGSPAPSPVRRKPLPSTASLLATRLSSPRLESAREENEPEAKLLAHQRSHTLDYVEQLP